MNHAKILGPKAKIPHRTIIILNERKTRNAACDYRAQSLVDLEPVIKLDLQVAAHWARFLSLHELTISIHLIPATCLGAQRILKVFIVEQVKLTTKPASPT